MVLSYQVVPELSVGPNYAGIGHNMSALYCMSQACNSLNSSLRNRVNQFVGTLSDSGIDSESTFVNSNMIGPHWLFDSLTSYATIDPSSSLIPAGAITGTLSLWVNIPTGGLPVLDKTFLALSATSVNKIQLILDGTANTFQLDTRDSGNAVTSVTSTTVAVENTWYNITAVLADQAAKLYVNGRLEATDTNTDISRTTVVNSTAATVGASSTVPAGVVTARIQMIAAWQRCLSAAEVRELYVQPYCVFMQ